MTPQQQYLQAIDDFNTMSDFKIIYPSENVIHKLIKYTSEIHEKMKDLDIYESIRKRGYSDDHLATEIGLFVLHLNQQTLNVLKT